MRTHTLPFLLPAVLALTLTGCSSGAETPAGESNDTSTAAPEGDVASANADGSATADEALGDAAGPGDEMDAGGGPNTNEWWNLDVSFDAEAPDTLQGSTGGECYETCIAKGGSEQECTAYCGGDKDDDGGELDQGCYDACIANEGKDEAACAAYCGGGSDDEGGKDDDGAGDGKDDTGLPEAVPCPDDFDPSEPCEGTALETACVVDGEWFWCEGGAWTNEK